MDETGILPPEKLEKKVRGGYGAVYVWVSINFKLLGMAKMLVYGSVIVRYCDFHEMTSYDYSF